MPRKDKKSKKGKAKKSLSTADILKLLKKLKPQTQQIVRVNVGDSDKKKKKGDVQSSYNPPFVFPTRENPAVTSLGQPPFKPPLIEEPRQAATWSSQPVKEPQQLMPPPQLRREIRNEAAPRNIPTTPLITDISESEFSEVELVSRRKPGKGYSVRAPPKTQESSSGYVFQAPKIIIPSNLSAASAEPTRFYQPVQNDRYQADIIQTNPAGDQIGTLADKISSALWTGTPEGEITLTPEQTQAAIEENQQPISLSDVFIEEPTFEELQQEQQQKAQDQQPPEEEEFEIEVPVKQKKSSVPVQGVSAPEKEMKGETGFKSISARATIDEINKAVRDNKFVITGIPAEYIATRGATKGQIKQESKNKIMSNEIEPVYQQMLKFTGQIPKKAPFIVKKPEE